MKRPPRQSLRLLVFSEDILVVSDRVEKMVVARVEARVNHASSNTKHSSTAILDLDIKSSVALFWVLNLSSERVSSRDGSAGSIKTTWKILWATGVFTRRHSNSISNTCKKNNLCQTQRWDVRDCSEAGTNF